MKVLIIGYKRSGKDTLAEIWKERFGIEYESSSMAAARLFIYDELKDKYGYSSFEECYEDRMDRRKEWYDLITDFNSEDPARLAKIMLETSDVYVGMRSDTEVDSCKEQKTFDMIVWVDAEERVGKESTESCTVTKEDAYILITNNGTEEGFRVKAIKLGEILFNGKIRI